MTLSDIERQTNQLTDENLSLALHTLKEQGFVILEAALPQSCVTKMRNLFDEESKRQFGDMGGEGELEIVDVEAARIIFKEQVDDVQHITHRGIRVPMNIRFFDPLIIENPFAMQILKAAMGQVIFTRYPYQSNTAWPGCPIQHIHRDSSQLAPNTPYKPSGIVVNIPLVDFTEENGATEVWPGSHLTVDERKPERGELENRVVNLPSIRTLMPAGSVVVRDLRCWHRGMANHTTIQRVMIAQVYSLKPSLGGLPTRQIIPSEIWHALSPQVQKMYCLHAPTNGQS